MVMDDRGNTFSQRYYVIAFNLQSKRFYTIWGVRFGKGPPVRLSREKEYRFLVRPLGAAHGRGEDVPCEIVKVWGGGALLYERRTADRAGSGNAPGR
jgi:hypothetical protein